MVSGTYRIGRGSKVVSSLLPLVSCISQFRLGGLWGFDFGDSCHWSSVTLDTIHMHCLICHIRELQMFQAVLQVAVSYHSEHFRASAQSSHSDDRLVTALSPASASLQPLQQLDQRSHTRRRLARRRCLCSPLVETVRTPQQINKTSPKPRGRAAIGSYSQSLVFAAHVLGPFGGGRDAAATAPTRRRWALCTAATSPSSTDVVFDFPQQGCATQYLCYSDISYADRCGALHDLTDAVQRCGSGAALPCTP